MKFLFNLSQQTLKIVQEDRFLIIPEERKFSYFGGIGFYLESGELNSWIIFSVHGEKVRVLYKVIQEDLGVYYRREIFRPPGGVVEVEFSEWDRVKKT